jgi:hypothetical protein
VINGMSLLQKDITQVKLVSTGGGAAGIACLNQLVDLGLKRENIILSDHLGVVYKGRTQEMTEQKRAYATETNMRTLEEAIEVLSWKRLDLHTKPVIFLNLNGFWEPLLSVMEHSIAQGMTPPSFRDAWVVCDTVEAAIAAVGTAGDMPHLQYDRR